MKYVLMLSLLLNIWYQFNEDIFKKYINYKYCNNKGVNSFQYSEYDILGINLFHINYVIEPYDNFNTVVCSDGTGNNQ